MKDKFDELINGNVPVIVDFSAGCCGLCNMMVPVLEQLKDKMGNFSRLSF